MSDTCSCCSGEGMPTKSTTKEAAVTTPRSGVWTFLSKWGLIVAGAVVFVLALVLPTSGAVRLGVFAVAYLLIGGDILLSAVKNITRGKIFDENFLMTVASLGAFAIGEHAEAVAVMLFYRVGDYFQELAVDRSRDSIAELMDLRPDFARLAAPQTKDGWLMVDPNTVEVGQTIVVRFGDKVPLDGVVVAGASTLDMAGLTGEARPVAVGLGDRVLSGSINLSETFSLQVDTPPQASTISKIERLIEESAAKKAPTEQFITKFARYYTPAVVGVAALLAVIPPLLVPDATFSVWVGRALIFLVVSCPCALVISVPLSYFAGIGGASRQGILVKGAPALDALAKIKTVVFDKTGTLTTCEYEGRKHLDERAKPDSKQAIAELRRDGVTRLVMLSGDKRAVVEDFGTQLGLDAVYGDLLPQDKVELFEQHQRAAAGGGLVAFVGDGVNDAPVLARADVGIAMGGVGSDAAIEAADVVLMTDEPAKLPVARRIAVKTTRIVWQNIIFALGIKALILLLSAFGLSTMWEAVFGDVGVALLATLNATRAMRG